MDNGWKSVDSDDSCYVELGWWHNKGEEGE